MDLYQYKTRAQELLKQLRAGQPEALQRLRQHQYGHNSVCEFLLDQGVDPAAQANVGQTGLHYAAHYAQLNTVNMLIGRKAPLEVKNMYGGTVLGQALWSALNEPQKDHIPIVETLIAAGAKIEPEWNKWIEELRRRQASDTDHARRDEASHDS